MTQSQSFLFPDTQIYADRSSVQRTRKQCMYWDKHCNGRYAGCNLFQNKRCRPSVCPDFYHINKDYQNDKKDKL